MGGRAVRRCPALAIEYATLWHPRTSSGQPMKRRTTFPALVSLLLMSAVAHLAAQDTTSTPTGMRADGSTPMRAYQLPISRFLSPDVRTHVIRSNRAADVAFKACPCRADTEAGDPGVDQGDEAAGGLGVPRTLTEG
jgi:hypothetical protein